MASVTLSSLVSSKGDFKYTFFSGSLQVGAGVTGDIITITPPSGSKARITGLSLLSSAGGAAESGITVTVGGTDIITTLGLSNDTNTAGRFSVLLAKQVNTAVGTAGYVADITGATNEVIVINKSGGNTANAIAYSYAYGA